MIKKVAHFLLAYAAYWFYGRPSRKLIVIGVTGTKGKSSACRFIAAVLEAGGYSVGLASTVEFQIGKKRWLNDRKMTMLGRGELHKMLRDMVNAGCQYAVVETSSEGILQYRHLGLNYDIAVFTNLGTEHQERHGGYENLRRDKNKMFQALTRPWRKTIGGKTVPTVIVVNADDKEAPFFLNNAADQKLTYGVQSANASLVASTITSSARGIDFVCQNISYHVPIVGSFNAHNALAALAVAQSQHINADQAKAGLASIANLPGRMEFIDQGQSFSVVVDYAHDPISYKALFTALRELVKPFNAKVIGIIGSDGGGRDVGKRPIMGKIAGELCDTVIVTDVNCFDDDPKEIAEMLARGSREAGKRDNENLFVIVDRRAAIAAALAAAKPHDVVVLTAKGTEPVMCVAGGKKIPWDDRAVARELLARV